MRCTHGPRRNVTQLLRLELPLAAAIPEAYRFMATQIRRSEKLYDLFFRAGYGAVPPIFPVPF